jgi:hypothetical protein
VKGQYGTMASTYKMRKLKGKQTQQLASQDELMRQIDAILKHQFIDLGCK